MKTHAQKPAQPQPTVSLQHNWFRQQVAEKEAQRVAFPASTDGGKTAHDVAAHAHFAHDFSRTPLHASAPVTIQPKLAINTSGDSYEQEADHVAEQVMHISVPQLQRACACGGSCSGCQTKQTGQEHQPLQTKRVGSSDAGQSAAPPIVHEALASPGQPLDPAIRAFMEPRFGHDFSKVRVHTDERAQMSAMTIGAHAYTVGNDIVFGVGRFDSNGAEGRRLLAHELTHVVQQTAGQGHTTLSRQAADSGLLQRKDDAKAKPKDPAPVVPAAKCHKGCSGHWGQDTTCSKWGFVSGVRDYGGKDWRGLNPKGAYCCNSWPFAVEQFAIDTLGLDGAASCASWHQKEVATVTLAGKDPIKVLCSDTICGDATACHTSFGESNDSKACWGGSFTKEVIELSPKAMQKLSGNQRTTPPVSVCYSGSQEGLCISDAPGPAKRTGKDSFPEAGDCLTKGCTPATDTTKLKDTGWTLY